MKRQLTSILLFSALLMGGASTFVSCTDHESDNAYNASISIADAVAKQLDALKLANQQLQANIDDLKSDVATNKDKIAALEAQVAANKAAIENLNGTWTEKFQKLNTQLNESIGALGNRATALEEAVDKINGQLPAELAKLNQAIQDIAELKTKSKEVDELQKKLDELNEKLYGKLAGEGDINTLKDAIDTINGQLKEAAKYVLAKLQDPKSTSLNLSGLASALYSNLNNQLTAYGVQASWKQKDQNGNEVEKVVTSEIKLAAFAVKPLSFDFLANNSKLDNLSLDRFMLPTNLSEKLKGISGLDFNHIIDPSTGKTIEVATIVAVPGVKIVPNGKDLDIIQISDGKVLNTIKNASIEGEEKEVNKDISIEGSTGSATLTTYIYQIKVKDDTMKDLIADLNKNLSTTLGPVKTALDWANTLAGKYDQNVAKVNNLIKKVEGVITNVNKYLQPAIMFKADNGSWNFVSTGSHFATSFVGVGATPLVATSYTAELLAPAYKKQLYVKEAGAEILVNGKATKSAFNGQIQKVVFNASKAGNYTIVYKAIDYSGKVVEKNFYVTVK
jgi:predicted  nucleic acid-binding Zn-ribbon protein